MLRRLPLQFESSKLSHLIRSSIYIIIAALICVHTSCGVINPPKGSKADEEIAGDSLLISRDRYGDYVIERRYSEEQQSAIRKEKSRSSQLNAGYAIGRSGTVLGKSR